MATTATTTTTATTGARAVDGHRGWRRTGLRVVLLAVVVALVPTGYSYATYLRAAGSAPVDVRTVDWLRDHGFAGIVNRIENWKYGRGAPHGSTPARSDLPSAGLLPPAVPPTTAPPALAGAGAARVGAAPSTLAPTTLPPTTLAPTTRPPTTPAPTTLPPTTRPPVTRPPTTVPAPTRPVRPLPAARLAPSTVPPSVPGATDAVPAVAPAPGGVTAGVPLGTWQDVPGLAAGQGALAVEVVRPDPAHPSVVATVVRFDPTKVRFVLVPGTREPGAGPWAWHSGVPLAVRQSLVAAFNSGFRFKDTPGGLFSEGRTAVRPLAQDVASAVIYADGTVAVGAWGRDVSMTPDVASVRQNLHLVVDAGKPVPGLETNTAGLWGSRKSQLQYTWRSGLGVDDQGRVLYVAGRELNLRSLAQSLTAAGAVRGMELDIHPKMVSLNLYRPAPGTPLGVAGTKLLASMARSESRYLAPDQRDFFAVVAR